MESGELGLLGKVLLLITASLRVFLNLAGLRLSGKRKIYRAGEAGRGGK